MELVPVKKTGKTEVKHPRSLTMTEEARELADIQTGPVERKYVTAEIRLVGKVEYDESRLAYITAWIPGRLDRLYADYTGIPVKKGDHMAYIYSPDILSTEEELLQSLRAEKELKKSGIGIMRETTRNTVAAARDRLRLWGLTDAQIKDIERGGAPSDHITIYAPIGGIVIKKNALEGMYVEKGTKIYTIADLSRVWIILDAYESDLEWLRYGQSVEFGVEAYSGETFTGKISFIEPFLNDATRTVKVRVDAPNPDGKLKPGMFVRAVVRANLAMGGLVMDPSLKGKWICPMHPDVIEDAPGDCPICGMPLVTPESLGYVTAEEKSPPPLVIPSTAPLITGMRAVVYVKAPDKEEPTFEGREIGLGPRAGDYYIVKSGLAEGEMVVTRGNFKIDSALEIEAKPSMMNPEGSLAPEMRHHSGESADN
jgi:Cu(I)/Ag(I) efflux system membrane fusion protein